MNATIETAVPLIGPTAGRSTALRYVARQDGERRVTWLELFFDLVFVAAVAQVAHPLREDYTPDGLLRFGVLSSSGGRGSATRSSRRGSTRKTAYSAGSR